MPASTDSLAPRRRWRSDLAEFLHVEAAGSALLLTATALALVVANTGLYEHYERFLHAEIAIQVGSWSGGGSVEHWVNDGLIALFFFVIGLEIKREIVVGELSTVRKAVLPILAALGGMIAPALIYLALNAGGPGADGWGVPMATDIAFALGVLALLGSRAPAGLRLFLTALAIVDDLGAIVVIAVFYSGGVSFAWLAVAFAVLALLAGLNRLRVDHALPYALLGLVVWFAFFNSGVHATIAGVLVALTIPTVSRLRPVEFCEVAEARLHAIRAADVPGAHVLDDNEQQKAAWEIRGLAKHAAAPLQRLEHMLHPVATFLVLPLFAFANAGVRLVDYHLAALVLEPVTLGIFFGLLLGKPIGVVGMTWLAVRLRLADLPGGVAWKHVAGGGVLAGIGFTMSLLIAALAFEDATLLAEAKLAVLATSVVAATAGFLFLRALSSRQ